MDKAVRDVVDRQKKAGIDIGNDGEQQRVGFQTYVPQRMTGFGGVSKRRRSRVEEFPELVALLMRRFPAVSKQAECTGGAKRNSLQGHKRHRRRDQAVREQPTQRVHSRKAS